jgi:hypothetical protein
VPELPRDRPHLYQHNRAEHEGYVSRRRGRSPVALVRDRAAHAAYLASAFTAVLDAAGRQAPVHADEARPQGGLYLEFTLPPDSQPILQSLEDRRRHIELVSVHSGQTSADPIHATVFVPRTATAALRKKIEAYRDQVTKGGKPKNELLVSRIESISLATVASFFTDEQPLPPVEELAWWELWVRPEFVEETILAMQEFGIRAQERTIQFPERVVLLALASVQLLERLVMHTEGLAELRLAQDTPALYMEMSNLENVEWVADLARRTTVAPDGPAICILDSGITRTHRLLDRAVNAVDVHSYNPAWGNADSAYWNGHGTAMAGLALYGDDLTTVLADTNEQIELRHRLESVKMLDPVGHQHEPELYGAVTSECVARPEVTAPHRARVFAMAVTSDRDVLRGRPSSWSAAIDQLCYNEEHRRLIVISTGNLERHHVSREEYLLANDAHPVLNPAQAWNALTVGSFTDRVNITDPAFAGWNALAPAGDLGPASLTSTSWEQQWPVKPDIVVEGGNWASDGHQVDTPDDLGLLTTGFRPEIQQFTILRDTSAATALAANLAIRVSMARPGSWPETVRGLIVHSAEWTARMKEHFAQARTRQDKRALLRRYGYGVPQYDRSVFSALNDATLIFENHIQPLRLDGREVKTNEMNLHRLPWPQRELRAMGEIQVQCRITLSYFIEPNPGDRGRNRRHRYASHGLRFAMKRGTETVDQFRARVNRAVELEDDIGNVGDMGEAGEDWFLGGVRDVGSIHADIWRGTATELADREAIAILPVGGWWKEKRDFVRWERTARYALIVTIRATDAEIDIYTPIEVAIAAGIPISV